MRNDSVGRRTPLGRNHDQCGLVCRDLPTCISCLAPALNSKKALFAGNSAYINMIFGIALADRKGST